MTLMTVGAHMIDAERRRQIAVEGHTPEHDAGHTAGELVAAAVAYANDEPADWPWRGGRPRGMGDGLDGPARISQLAKAGALIAAEIDRLAALHRAAVQAGTVTP